MLESVVHRIAGRVWFPDDPKQTPWYRLLDEIVEVGYEWTELVPHGYLPTDLSTL